MSFLANIPLLAVTVLYFLGRLFESLKITDYSTGFLTDSPLVSRAIIVALICVIAISSSVIIMMQKQSSRKSPQLKTGVLGLIAGVLFIVGAVLSIMHTFRVGGFLGFDILILLSGIGYIIFALVGVHGQNIEKLSFVLVMLGALAFCLGAFLSEVRTVSDVIYTTRNLAHITMALFLLCFFKNAYARGDLSDIALYRTGFLNTVFSLAGLLALTLGIMSKGTIVTYALVYDAGCMMVGLLSLITSMSLVSNRFSGLRVNERELAKRSANFATGELMPGTGEPKKNALERRFSTKEIKRETEATDATGFLGITPDQLKARADEMVRENGIRDKKIRLENRPERPAPVFNAPNKSEKKDGIELTRRSSEKKRESAAKPVEKKETVKREPAKAAVETRTRTRTREKAPSRDAAAPQTRKTRKVFSRSADNKTSSHAAPKKKVFVADDSDAPAATKKVKKKIFTRDD